GCGQTSQDRRGAGRPRRAAHRRDRARGRRPAVPHGRRQLVGVGRALPRPGRCRPSRMPADRRGPSEAPRGCRGGGGGRHLRRGLPCRARGGALMTTPQGLAAEDAAVYGYGLVLSGAGPSIRAAATRELTAHRARRDAAEALWPDAPPAPTGYSTSEDTSLYPVLLAIRLA